ncbi:chlororespiratory reduction protein 7, partial [Nostoc sp. HG1]|nr:chlororespiratory reduction protein 7 [Nostoc sp. HG1]
LQSLILRKLKHNILLDTTCKLDIAPGQYLQWYAVRLEK